MAPCRARSRAICSPMPLLPPVMRATLPVRSTGGGERVRKRRPRGNASTAKKESR